MSLVQFFGLLFKNLFIVGLLGFVLVMIWNILQIIQFSVVIGGVGALIYYFIQEDRRNRSRFEVCSVCGAANPKSAIRCRNCGKRTRVRAMGQWLRS